MPRQTEETEEPEDVIEDESKADRFHRLGKQRMGKTIQRFRLVRNLANRGTYEYTQEEAKAIVERLQAEVDETRTAFEGTKSKDDDFDFDVSF